MATVRAELNASNLNRLNDLTANISTGELLTLLISVATPTEAAVAPVLDVATLAAVPSEVFQVNATAGTVTGVKTVTKGVVATALPATGEAVWEVGTALIKFSAADAVTAASFLYATAADKASALERTL